MFSSIRSEGSCTISVSVILVISRLTRHLLLCLNFAGIVANSLSIAILANRTMKTQISALLITLAIYDILFLLCIIPVFAMTSIGNFVHHVNTCVYPDGNECKLVYGRQELEQRSSCFILADATASLGPCSFPVFAIKLLSEVGRFMLNHFGTAMELSRISVVTPLFL